jgi:hypothetical protein
MRPIRPKGNSKAGNRDQGTGKLESGKLGVLSRMIPQPSICRIFKIAPEPNSRLAQSNQAKLADRNGGSLLNVSPCVRDSRGSLSFADLFVGGHACSKMNGSNAVTMRNPAEVHGYVQ